EVETAAQAPAPDIAAALREVASSNGTKRLKPFSAVWMGIAATVLIAIGAVSASAWRLATARAADHEAGIARAPFPVDASDASASYVREGLLELLGSRIPVADGKRGTDPARVLRASRSTGFMSDGATTPTIADAVRLGKSLGADEIVAGS